MERASETVRVAVRVRPLSDKEQQDRRITTVFADESRGEMRLIPPGGGEEKLFTFDHVYGPKLVKSGHYEVYDVTASSIVDSVLQGFNGTIFAYGQTGSGKTHTMEGYADPPELRGIIPTAFKHIFDSITTNSQPTRQFLVRVSYVEIYNEDVRDLLAKDPTNKLEVKEHVETGVYVKDLIAHIAKSAMEMELILQAGKKNRVTGATLMNATSSRSHAIFTITVETCEPGRDGKQHFRVGKLNLVDLAGSERIAKTGATGERLEEAKKINLSLLTLGAVISSLVDGKSSHIPYRESKLTRLLQDSLGAPHVKQVMIANCGPADYNYDETLQTLRYASRAKLIKNKPKINEDPKDAMLREYQEEINRLKARLAEEEARARATATTTILVDGKEVQIPATAAQVKVVEKVRVVGVSEEEVKALQEKAAAEQSAMMAKLASQQESRLRETMQNEEARKKLQAEITARAQAHAEAEREKLVLARKLEAMQEKLLIGVKVLDKAARQEEELRRAQLENEERRRQQSDLARQLEEANLMIEEQYASLAEEVEAKTRKLKKVWHRWQSAKQEIKDLTEEFATERADMMEELRDVKKQLALKMLLLEAFVPTTESDAIESRAVWDDEAEEWSLRQLDLAGNRLRVRRPPSTISPASLLLSQIPMVSARPQSQYGVDSARFDGTNPRFQQDNIVSLVLDVPSAPTVNDRVADAVRSTLSVNRTTRLAKQASGLKQV